MLKKPEKEFLQKIGFEVETVTANNGLVFEKVDREGLNFTIFPSANIRLKKDMLFCELKSGYIFFHATGTVNVNVL